VHRLKRAVKTWREAKELIDPEHIASQTRSAAHQRLIRLRIVFGAEASVDPHLLFDSAYYTRTNPEAAKSRRSPLYHYLTSGARAGLQPHPLFDSAHYLDTNSDVRKAGVNPLVHYVRNGRREGRSPHPLFDSTFYGRQTGGPSDLIHYIRLGEAKGLSPHPLFDPRHYAASARSGAKDGGKTTGKIWASGRRNASRDRKMSIDEQRPEGALAAFLAETQPHKSPSPLFDMTWYATMNSDVNEAEANPLYHYLRYGWEEGRDPVPWFSLESYWSRYTDVPREIDPYVHWLVYGRDEGRTPNETASMAMSLRPLIYFDPEPEPSRPSITAPEATEESDGPTSAQDLTEIIQHQVDSREASTVTFDVWDTLLRRDTAPDALKLQSARFLAVAGAAYLRAGMDDVTLLYKERLQAEARVARGPDREYLFDDVARDWLVSVLRPSTPAHQVAPLREHLINHEIASEIHATRPDEQAMLAVTNAVLESTAVGYVSDFYLSSAALSTVLEANGYARAFDLSYVSCEVGIAKRSGRLYDHIINETDLRATDWIHVGDNWQADVEEPASVGISAIHFRNEAEEILREAYVKAHEALISGNPTPTAQILAADLGADPLTLIRDSRLDLEKSSRRLAVLALGYALFVLDEALSRGSATIYCFTREGQTIKTYIDSLIDADIYGLRSVGRDYPDTTVLEVSRLSTFNASLSGATNAELMRLWMPYPNQSLRALSVSLRVDTSVFDKACLDLDLDPDVSIREPWADDQVDQLLEYGPFADAVEQRRRADRVLLLEYLKTRGVGQSTEEMLTADIGWRGTIQDNLAYLLPDTRIHGCYLGLFHYLNDQPKNASKTAWLFDKNLGEEVDRGEYLAPIETLFSAPGGSVSGYLTTDHSKTEREIDPQEEAVLEYQFGPFQQAILSSVPAFCRRVRLAGITSYHLRGLGLHLLDEYMNRPPLVLARGFNRLPHNERFGTGAISRSDEDSFTVEDAGTGSEFHGHWRRHLDLARWPGAFSVEAAEDASHQPVELHSYLPTAIRKLLPYAALPSRHRVGLYLPPLTAGSGGQRTIVQFALALADNGFDTSLMLERSQKGDGTILDSFLGGKSVDLRFGIDTRTTYDVAIATIGYSAFAIARDVKAHHKAYFVQDFEAAFHPTGTYYLRDEISYSLGLHALTIGHWLTHVIRNDYGGEAIGSGLGIDHETYRLLDAAGRDDVDSGERAKRSSAQGANLRSAELEYPVQPKRENAVCFLYQPEKPRRAVELAVKALVQLRRRRPDVTIYTYGSDDGPPAHLEATHLGLVRDFGVLNSLYNRVKVGLCISSTNPSRIPFEMMAAGCVPVDLYRYNNLFDYPRGAALLAFQSSDSISAALISLLEDRTKWELMSGVAVESARTLTEAWEKDVLTNGVFDLVERGRLRPLPIEPRFADPPFISPRDRRPEVESYCAHQWSLACR